MTTKLVIARAHRIAAGPEYIVHGHPFLGMVCLRSSSIIYMLKTLKPRRRPEWPSFFFFGSCVEHFGHLLGINYVLLLCPCYRNHNQLHDL